MRKEIHHKDNQYPLSFIEKKKLSD